jgi:hypothetical protein
MVLSKIRVQYDRVYMLENAIWKWRTLGFRQLENMVVAEFRETIPEEMAASPWNSNVGAGHSIVSPRSQSSQPKDSINTLGGVVSALALSFVLGLQYMVAPGTDEMQYADFRSMRCKSQEPAELTKGDGSVDSML